MPIVSRRANVSAYHTVSDDQRSELDNHADTCCVSEDTSLIIHDYETPVTVSAYSDDLANKTCRTVTAVVAHDTHDGTTWYLHIHQALDIPRVRQNLICAMQLRDRGLRVNDEPKHMVPNPTEYHHAITIPADKYHAEIIIPLGLYGVTHYFPTRKPTREEYENSDTTYHIDLTESEIPWEPAQNKFQEAEEAMLDARGKLRPKPETDPNRRLIAAINREQGDVVPEDDLCEALRYHCNVSAVHTKDR